jgi:hypothetical protein
VAVASLYLNQVAPSPAWLSPALTVVKSAGLDQNPGTPILDVDPGPPSTESQQIRAVAGNDGTPAATFSGVRVQLWALAFATSTASSLYLGSMGGTKGITIPAGGAMPIDIGPGQQQPFERDWDATYDLTSTEPEIVSHFAGDEVHCCIYGNVHHANDPGSAAIPDVPSGPGPLLDVAGNRHHAQRNMTIQKHDAGGAMAFGMYAANPDPDRDQVFALHIAELAPRELAGWEVRELDGLGPWIRRTRKAPGDGIPGIEVVVDGKTHPVRIAREPLKDLEMDVSDAGAAPELKVELGADEARRMRLNATIPDEELVLRIVDVTQTRDGATVGGARVMVMTVPEELRGPKREYEQR